MTALAGLWCFDGRPDAADGCARMLAAQQVYGPHHCGQWSDTAVALGRRMMRVLPEDAFDRQPLISSRGRYVIVADVRLDNRDELTEALRLPAVQSRNLCDAAILLAAIERWDESCVEHLVGDYAFAAWDGAGRRLLLARDPLGQRPLHYHRGNKFFAFASMPKGLHALPEVPYAPNKTRVAEFLVLMAETGSESFFVGVERVQPGHLVTITPDGFDARRHWQPIRRRIQYPRLEDYAEALRDVLDQAVSCRLRGTGDIGAYLSGGFDSGAVAATAARLLARSNRRVIALTGVPRQGYKASGPDEGIIDEGPFAAATAALYPNIKHVVVHNEGRSPLADLDRWFFLADRPIRGISGTGWRHSLDNAIRKQKLRVILGGSCGNYGLSYDGMELLPELFRSGYWLRLWVEASALVSSGMRWRGVLAKTLGPWCSPGVWGWANRLAGKSALEISDVTAINPQRFEELDIEVRTRVRDYFARPWKDGFGMRLHFLQYTDPGNYNKAGLANLQVDYRDPTADVRLLEFCLGVPTEKFLHKGTRRALARCALADRLPKQVLEQKRPSWQCADWHEDLTAARHDILDEIDRLEACEVAATTLDLPRLRSLMKDWPSSGWERGAVELRYRYTLQRAVAVGHFLRRATGSNR